MQAPFTLRHRTEGSPATALLLLSHTPADVLGLCAELGHDPLPRLYSVADGILLILDAPVSRPFVSAIRLRGLAEHLFSPVDADLEPQLRADEMAGLTRSHGLIFLPGDRVLAYDRESPLDLANLLAVGSVRRDGWETLPQARSLPEAIRSITLELPAEGPDDIVGPGGEGIGTEDPRPAGASPGKTAANKAKLRVGKMMQRLGKALGLDRLREAGQRMIDGALEAVPRLAETVYGEREAALRDLLQKFKEGKVDDALKRAIPKGEESERRPVVNGGASLPMHNLRYSLGNILGGGSGSGPASIWYGHDQVVQDLFREYRKAAEAAANQGDFRRAAFIYGKLLAEWRSAAAVLARGGLHHDAAILYRDKVDDPRQAAKEFESAGEFDAALVIFDKLNDHESAGDILRRMGEEERAVERFMQAADAMMQQGRGPLAAGEFVLRKTQREALAETWFATGWSLRHVSLETGNAVPCAVHLAEMYARKKQPDDFLKLLKEGEHYFAKPGNATAAGTFFNTLVAQVDQPAVLHSRDEVRDRCLIGLANKVREHGHAERRPGTVISTLLGESRLWEAPVVRDAAFALKALQKSPSQVEAPTPGFATLQLCAGTTTAARIAPNSGEVFAGFESGEVIGFRPAESRILHVGKCPGRILALGSDMRGDLVVAQYAGDGETSLRCFRREAPHTYVLAGEVGHLWDAEVGIGVAPLILSHPQGPLVVQRVGPGSTDLALFRGADLLPLYTPTMTEDQTPWPLDLPLMESVPGCPGPAVLAFQKGGVDLVSFEIGRRVKCRCAEGRGVDWMPSQVPENTLCRTRLAWGHDGTEHVEVAGLNAGYALYWLRLALGKGRCEKVALHAAGCAAGYRTASLMQNSRLVGITRENRLVWLRAGHDRLAEWATGAKLQTPSPAIACFYTRPTGEIIVLHANGYLTRVPVPA